MMGAPGASLLGTWDSTDLAGRSMSGFSDTEGLPVPTYPCLKLPSVGAHLQIEEMNTQPHQPICQVSARFIPPLGTPSPSSKGCKFPLKTLQIISNLFRINDSAKLFAAKFSRMLRFGL